MSEQFEQPLVGGSVGVDFAIAGLYEIKEYHSTMERVILETGNWRLASIHRRASELPIDERERFKTFNMPLRWLKSFPSQLRASVIVSGMSFFESQLWQISRGAQYFSKVTFEKPKEKIMSSYRSFFIKHGNLKIPTNKEWKVLNDIYSIRNQLVHNSMSMGCSDDDFSHGLDEIRKNVSGITLDEEGWFSIDKEACDQMFDAIEGFLKHLRNEVAEKWESSTKNA